MKRADKHRHKSANKNKIKVEMPGTSSSSRPTDKEEHDLAYYIHDRVELMHQVFSIIKAKDLKAMAPQCVKHLSLARLQELCTEELLGISSKRLCAILDGAEPPSDTETTCSSPENLETISLDSISSDEEILSNPKNKKRKHKKHKSRRKHKKQPSDNGDSGEEHSSSHKAGPTVLELLELQARARAIKSQLEIDQSRAKIPETVVSGAPESTDSEVEIKEEPSEVVEISSEDEKPNVKELEKSLKKAHKKRNDEEKSNSITKHVNDLVITVPQTKQTRKIKLTRTKVTREAPQATSTQIPIDSTKELIPLQNPIDTITAKDGQPTKTKKRTKRKKQKKNKSNSDNDEITLQLSDTEKMNLLEDLDKKHYSSSHSSQDSKSHSDSDVSNNETNEKRNKVGEVDIAACSEANKGIATLSVLKNRDQNKGTIDEITTDNNKTDIKNLSEGELSDNANSEMDTLDFTSEVKKNTAGNVHKIGSKEISMSKSDDEGKSKERNLYESQVSDDAKSQVTTSNLVTEVICSSDDEKQKVPNDNINMYKSTEEETQITGIKGDDSNEVFELSDDSSCYEIEGNLLSKAPTSEEIEAFSAKIDDISAVTNKQISEYQISGEEKSNDENVSWKDRYLDSKKVKRVLKISNILNAMRKNNIELKRKLEESKKVVLPNTEEEKINLSGTLEEYNTLEGSTKYVDPVVEQGEDKETNQSLDKAPVTKEMEKDAQKLLKMYKKLLKYNDINRKSDPNKKKKKKSKKSKEKNKEVKPTTSV